MREGLGQRSDAQQVALQPEHVMVVSRGTVPEDAVEYARRKISRVVARTARPVLFARVKLLHHADPARKERAVVDASLDVNGDLVRAHCAAPDFHAAIDLVDERLQDRLKHLAEHRRAQTRGRRERSVAEPAE